MPSTPTIVAFTKDWNDVPTCTTHVLREMARTMPVLWINSIGMRKPSLASARDFRRLTRKLRDGLRRAAWKETHLHVLSPLVVPKGQTAIARAVNRRLLSWIVNRETRRLGPENVELWTFIPNAVDYVGCLREKKVIYYCPDDWSKFTFLDPAWVERCERELLQRADLVFVTARYLERKFRPLAGAKLHYVPHGVSHARFAAALAPSTVVPPEFAALPKPVIGFYGNLYGWIDFDLVRDLARLRPDWSFVMIGPVFSDLSRFRDTPNVHFPGRREPDQLPACCKAFDVAFIPYNLADPRMESVNPVKLRELLAAGLPVVATDVPEIRGLSRFAAIARSAPEFAAAITGFLDALRDQPQLRQQISREQLPHDWSQRVRDLRRIVDGGAAGSG